MADEAHSTVVRLPHEHDATIGMIARRWEGALGDILDLANVTAEIVDDAVDIDRTKLFGKRDCYHLPAQKVRNMLFCIYELTAKIERFRDTYYAAIEAR